MKTGIKLQEAVTKLLTGKLSKRMGEKFDKSACTSIYQDIFFTLSEVVKEAQIPLSNESVNFLSQMYYDSVTINNNQELDPNIFTQRASLNNVPTKEIALMATMMSGTPFAHPFIFEAKKRS